MTRIDPDVFKTCYS